MNNNGYQQYRQQMVNTMTKDEMLILLYDESIKRLVRAQFNLEHQNYDEFNDSVERVEKIIRYLSSILDHKYPISAELYRLYDYFLFRLGQLKAGRNKEVIDDIKPKIIELRDAFKEASKSNGKA